MQQNDISRDFGICEIGRWDFGPYLRNPLVVGTGRTEGHARGTQAGREGICGGYDRIEIPRSNAGFDIEKRKSMSSPLNRLWEKLFGIPHKHREADRVSFASKELSREVREVSNHLKPYAEADDPLVAMMTDIFNNREMSRGK